MRYIASTTTQELEAAVERYWCPNPFPKLNEFTKGFGRLFMQHCAKEYGGYLSMEMLIAILTVADDLYEQEDFHEVDFRRQYPTHPLDIGRYRDGLFYLLRYAEYEPKAILEDFTRRVLESLDEFLAALPRRAFFPNRSVEYPADAPSEPFLNITGDDTHLLVEDVVRPFVSPAPFGLFASVRSRLERNAAQTFKGEALPPREWRGDPRKSVRAYLDGMPFYDLFQLRVPNPPPPALPEPVPGEPLIEDRYWYQHCLLLADTGAGKTNAIRWRIAQILPNVARGEASLIIIEPKGVLTRDILHLASTWGMRERVVLFDPSVPVAVNLFSRGDGSPTAINDAVQRVSRVFNTITSTLTPFQRATLTYALRAMFASTESPSMRTLMSILRNGIDGLTFTNLSPAIRDFFEYDFGAGTAQNGQRRRDTRAGEIIQRLNNLIADPVFETLFASEHTSFDMFEAIQRGSLILVNTADTDPLYGRFWIEEVGRCIRPRLQVADPRSRTPTILLIDEAQTYIKEDLHFAEILDKAREARIGVMVAAHHMAQITEAQVRDSLYTNTALKFVARTSADIHNLCRSMGRTEPEFLTTMRPYHFAYFCPGMPQATIVYLPLTEFDSTSLQMTQQQHATLLRENSERVGAPLRLPVHAPAEKSGHVWLNVIVNGATVEMLVDTGATNVSLSLIDAQSAGIIVTDASFTGTTNTANGRTRYAPIIIGELQVGEIVLNNVRGGVLENLSGSLLGQAFLSQLESYQMRGGTLTMTPKPTPPDSAKPDKQSW